MRAIDAHKFIAARRPTVIGHEAHSSQVQRGVSSVMTAAKLITFIDGMMAENQAKADPHCSFVPPYTTLHVGVVHGGTALNIISRECSFTWDIRPVQGDDWRGYTKRLEEFADGLLPAMRSTAPNADRERDVKRRSVSVRVAIGGRH